ncbi:MAG: PQQ-binding-like beta-propeller repeat protein [Candidatus Bathyarchaeota archaeon]|nr:PQQ-binding-like beta-propeller repeat protein [Candidatus Bathyarchaeota archaeon]
MKKTKNKTISTLISAILTITMIASTIFAVLPAVNAQSVQKYPTFIYAAVAPNPVGVGQPVTVVTWTAEMPPDIGEANRYVSSPTGRAGWSGLTLTVTDPDGKTENFNLPYTDPVGSTWYTFTPDKIGNYTFVTHFPETWKNSTENPTAVRRLYAAADSPVCTLTVQEEQLVPYVSGGLPTEYWSRPIYPTNREWGTISGNWMTGLRDLPYITAPNSAHVLWTAPYGFGGITGGLYSNGADVINATDISYHTGSAYEGKFASPQIINGWLFYTQSLEDSVTTTHTKIIARDLVTGEIYWTQNGTSTAGSSIYMYSSPNQHGTHPYLWTSGVAVQALSPGVTPPANTVVDPFTGSELFNFINVPSGTWCVGPSGERMQIVFGGSTSNRTWMALWNSSAIPSMLLGNSSTNLWQYRPVGKQHNGTLGYSWNVTLPPNLGTTYQVYYFDDRVISGTGFVQFGTSQYNEQFTVWSVSLKPETRGQLMWKIAPKPPAANVTLQWSSASVKDGVLVLRAKETMQFIGFDINTGAQLWITDPQPSWMMYSSGSEIQNGILYSGGYGGQVFAYDVHTGKLLWIANTDPEGLESAYDMTPLTIQVVDGKIYARSQEHSHTQPLYRTWKVYCFNATTGDRIWTLNGYWSEWAFSSGIGVSLNSMDNQIYAIGKGPSAITAEVTNDQITFGNNVLIKGMVTDISAGTQNSVSRARFPQGVPAVSDESMTDWMQYVYQQAPRPADTKGVTVDLYVIDSNGNYRPIGTTTSDANGFYSYNWTPDIEGKYTVIASFAGSNSYWPSRSETAFQVNAAIPTPTQQPVAAAPPTEMYILGLGVAIIIAIAIVGVVLLMAIKKRA